MNKNLISWIITVVSVVLLSLTAVQLYWVKNAIFIERTNFENKVNEAVSSVIYRLEKLETYGNLEAAERAQILLETVGLSDKKDSYPSRISGGQKQRVAVARALVTEPKLILADEPTANLDHKTAYMVIDIMKKMKEEFGTTFIFSTHDQKIVGEVEEIYMLEDGELADRHVKGGKGNV